MSGAGVAAFVNLRLSPSQLMAFRTVMSELITRQVVRSEVFIDVINDRETKAEELLELVLNAEPQLPVERPPNTVGSIELDAHLEREQAAARQRVAFERGVHVDDVLVGELPPAHLDLSPGCHRGAAMAVKYQNGVLEFSCVLCGSRVINVAVGAL